MQLVNSIVQNAPDFQHFGNNNPPHFQQRGQQQTFQNFAPQQVNSSNAPQWMNDMAIPMDTSNRACTPRQQGQCMYGNVTQTNQVPPRRWPPRKCFRCDREGHLAAQCRTPRQAQINSIIDEPEEMKNIQTPITLDGILNNALAMFDHLSDHQKDRFIQRYEGKSQDFPGV